MRYTFFILLTLLVGFNIQAQTDFSYYNYGSKTTLYEENFDEPRGTWAQYAQVAQGKCIFDGESSPGNFSWKFLSKNVTVDESKDYEIETSFKITGGTKSNHVGVVFGMNPNQDNFYFYGVNSNQKYRISWKGSNSIKKGRKDHAYAQKNININLGYISNKLTIRKANGQFYFFVNEVLIDQFHAQILFGSHFGIAQELGGTVVEYDYFRISYLHNPNRATHVSTHPTTEATRGDPVTRTVAPTSVEKGTYYALLISVNDYDDPNIKDLNNPRNDAMKLGRVLNTHYVFDSKNIEYPKQCYARSNYY